MHLLKRFGTRVPVTQYRTHTVRYSPSGLWRSVGAVTAGCMHRLAGKGRGACSALAPPAAPAERLFDLCDRRLRSPEDALTSEVDTHKLIFRCINTFVTSTVRFCVQTEVSRLFT